MSNPNLAEAMRDFLTSRDEALCLKLTNAIHDAILEVSPKRDDGAVLLINREILAALVDCVVAYAVPSDACATAEGRIEFCSCFGGAVLLKLAPARGFLTQMIAERSMAEPEGHA